MFRSKKIIRLINYVIFIDKILFIKHLDKNIIIYLENNQMCCFDFDSKEDAQEMLNALEKELS